MAPAALLAALIAAIEFWVASIAVIAAPCGCGWPCRQVQHLTQLVPRALDLNLDLVPAYIATAVLLDHWQPIPSGSVGYDIIGR